MATTCDDCGYKDNEVKSGSEICDKGRRITLMVEGREDFSRDLLKVRHLFISLANKYISSTERNFRPNHS